MSGGVFEFQTPSGGDGSPDGTTRRKGRHINPEKSLADLNREADLLHREVVFHAGLHADLLDGQHGPYYTTAVNGEDVGHPNFNDTTPAAPAGGANVKFQSDGSNVSAYLDGAGDFVSGPTSATDSAVALFDGTTGKLIKNSGVTVDGSNNVMTPGVVTAIGDTKTPQAANPGGATTLWADSTAGNRFKQGVNTLAYISDIPPGLTFPIAAPDDGVANYAFDEGTTPGSDLAGMGFSPGGEGPSLFDIDGDPQVIVSSSKVNFAGGVTVGGRVVVADDGVVRYTFSGASHADSVNAGIGFSPGNGTPGDGGPTLFDASGVGQLEVTGAGVTVPNNLEVGGKLTVAGLIDPTGLALTPVSANPGGAMAAETLWADDNTAAHRFTQGSNVLAYKSEVDATQASADSYSRPFMLMGA